MRAAVASSLGFVVGARQEELERKFLPGVNAARKLDECLTCTTKKTYALPSGASVTCVCDGFADVVVDLDARGARGVHSECTTKPGPRTRSKCMLKYLS